MILTFRLMEQTLQIRLTSELRNLLSMLISVQHSQVSLTISLSKGEIEFLDNSEIQAQLKKK